MNAKRIRKLRDRIKTWKVWFSSGLFGFHGTYDVSMWKLATPNEPRPDAIVYGLDLEDAFKRYGRKHPYSKAAEMRGHETQGKTFAKAVALPNNGKRLSPCDWHLNIPSDLTFVS